MTRRADRIEMVLWAYPRAYRARRGEEILGTLREGASSRGTFETWRVALDVVAYGLRRRLGTASDQPGGRVLAAAALPGMTMAAAIAAAMVLFGLLLPDIPSAFGPNTATWPALYLVWVLGALGAVAFPKHKRIYAAACVLVSVVTMVFVPKGFDHQWLPAISLLTALAVPALLGPPTSPRRSHRGFALLLGGACLGALLATATMNSQVLQGGRISYLEFKTFAPYVAAAVLLCAAILLVVHRWIDATALSLLAIPWLVFGILDHQAFGAVPTFYAVWAALACAGTVGLIGSRMPQLVKTSEPVH